MKLQNLEAGASLDDIMEWFERLDREQVKAVIEFVTRSLDKTPSSAVLFDQAVPASIFR